MIKIKPAVRTFIIYSFFLASATAVNASITPSPPQPNIQSIIQSLNLTDNQRIEAFTLIDEYQESMPEINIENATSAIEKQLMLVTQSEFDEAAMGELIDQVHVKEKEFFLHDMRLKNNVYNVLTEEQKVKFKASVKELLRWGASQ